MGFTAGWIDERETMLGSLGQGAFGGLSAGTAFAGFHSNLDVGSWRFGGERRVRRGEPGGPGRHDPGDLPARDQHLRGPREPGVRRPGSAALLAVAAAPGGKRVGLADGARGPHETGRGAPKIVPGGPRPRGTPARPGGAVEPAAPARRVPPRRPLEPPAGPPRRPGAATRAPCPAGAGRSDTGSWRHTQRL